MNKQFALVLAVAFGLACDKAPAHAVDTTEPYAVEAVDAGSPQEQLAADAPPVPAELPAVLARVNGEPIERGEFERAIRNLETNAGRSVPDEQRNAVFRGVLDQLIAYRLLSQESAAREISISDAEVDEQISALRGQFPDDDAFRQALAAQQLTVERLREDARTEMRIARMIETDVLANVTVEEQEIADFYKKNPEEFQQAESVRASHILFHIAEDADDATRRRIRADAETVLAQARAGGDFAALAGEHSQDPGSASQGGDLDFFERGQMVPAFEAAAFALNPGEVSDLVETPFGLHIIKVTEKQPARTVPLAEAKDAVREFLLERGRQQEVESFVARLKQKGKIEILI